MARGSRMTAVIAAFRTRFSTPLECVHLSDCRRVSGSLLKGEGSVRNGVVHHENEDCERPDHGEDTSHEGWAAQQAA